MWIRHEGAFPASVPTDTFRLAEHARLGRSKHYTTTQLLDMLRQLAAEHGRVSGLLIDCAPGLPSAQMFRYRFGSLTEAYRLAGVVTHQQEQCTSTRARLHELRTSLMARVWRCIHMAGGSALQIAAGCVLINNQVVMQLQIVRAHTEQGGALRWRIRLAPTQQVDFVIAAVMESANRDISHFLLIPRSLFKHGYFGIPSKRSVEVQDHRFETLDAVFGL
jgi:hypothetical protein